ncbi:non-specific lipid-transfer protein 1 [Manihot esculenta]|uniref:Bifunctional inhibitor/plant lipid transfer protein/seed storage helical domain-containing protein n=1 Tax=Manihot esculenta TaxID=3983 RepID=A0A2C9WNT0_MANES|nr:non-specific lipid-transfer protein 1 [Manihot esculenta]OAY62169.1 hypothetical protein MANES_01G246800v8 [Manihot esculenta]
MSRAEAMTRLAGLLILLLLVSKPAVSETVLDINCSAVITSLTPCLDYIQDKADKPSPTCCDGMNSVVGTVKSKADREALCDCLKQTLSNIKYDPARISALPKQCGLPIDIPPITPTTDCTKFL